MASRQTILDRKSETLHEVADLVEVLRTEASQKQAQRTVERIAERLDAVVSDVGILEREGGGA